VQAGCWAAQDASAAKIRDLQTRLMVAALRCRLGGQNLLGEYNDFVRTNRTAIQSANDRLKARFHREHGAVEGQRRYDRFTTALANAYGAGSNANCSDDAVLAREARIQDGSSEGLLLVADRSGAAPELPGGACPIVMAAK
jgi:hypothetical protein